MASSPTNTSIPLHEQVFHQFLHDVHHAYLLLHRAMALLPPTMIPNMEPTPLPSTGIWDQPDGFLPHYSAHTNAFIDRVELPSPATDEEKGQQDDQNHCALPEPHSHVTAPNPDEVPDTCRFSIPDKTPAKRPRAKNTPKAPAKRPRRTTKTSPRSPSPTNTWTVDEKKKLRILKADERSRYSWKVVATKMGKTEAEVKAMWNRIKDDSD